MLKTPNNQKKILTQGRTAYTYNSNYPRVSDFYEVAPMLLDTPAVYVFKGRNKPILNDYMRRRITYNIEFYTITSHNYEQRLKSENYFVKYPGGSILESLTTGPQKERVQTIIGYEGEKRNLQIQDTDDYFQERRKDLSKRMHEFISEVNEMHESKPMGYNNQGIYGTMEEAKLWSAKIFAEAKKLKYEIKGFVSKERQKVAYKVADESLTNMSFDDIITMNDYCFYSKNYKSINIFKFLQNDNDSDYEYFDGCINKYELAKYFFDYTSVVEKVQTFKVPIYRDLSQMARKLVLGLKYKYNVKDFLYATYLNLPINYNAIMYMYNCLSMASGRITSELIDELTKNEGDVTQFKKIEQSYTSSTNYEILVYYRDSDKNYGTEYVVNNYEVKESEDYLHMKEYKAVTKNKTADMTIQSLVSVLDAQQLAEMNNIRDKQYRQTVEEKKQNIVADFFPTNNYEDLDKVVRMNKSSKGSSYSAHLTKLLEIAKIQKYYEKNFYKEKKNGQAKQKALAQLSI